MSSRRARGRYHLARAVRSLRAIAPGELAGQVANVVVGPETVRIDGWAALPTNDIQSVFVTIDGIVRGHADIWFPTPIGPAGQQLTAAANAGWRLSLPREQIEVGVHSIGGLVLRAYGLVEVLDPIDASFPPPGPVGDINQPENGQVVSGILAVRGWFLTGRGYDTVEVSVNGATPVRARLVASPRPELVGQVVDPDAPLAGWEALIPLDEADGDPRYLEEDADLDEIGENTGVIVDMRGPRGHTRMGDRVVRQAPRELVKVKVPERAAAIEALTAELAAGFRADASGLNLLVATHHLGLGGGQLYVQELLRHLLAEPDVKATVLSMVDGVLAVELEDLGARVHVVGQAPSTARAYEDWLNQIAIVIEKSGANAMLANTAAAYWGVDLAARLKIPSAWAIHESFTPEVFLQVGFSVPPDEQIRARFLAAFEQADAVVFEADATKRLFEHLIREGRALTVDYGIDLGRIRAFARENPRDELREKLEIRPDQILLMCMGTYEPRKAQGLLTAAFARVADDYSRAVLAMVGDQGGPFSEGVHAMVEGYGLEGRVRMVPLTKDIDDWYLAADAFILASDVESLPRSMLEAMGFGTPVIAPAVFGVPEVIDDNINGFLFDPSSVAGAAEVMRRFLRLTRAERVALGERGRATVEANRSGELYARDYAAIYRALAAGGAPDLAAALKVARG